MQGPPSHQKIPNQATWKRLRTNSSRQEKEGRKTEEKETEAKTDEVADLADLKDSLQALKEVKILLQEFPTPLEAARRSRQAKTKQEKALIVLSALMGD
ncbi:hypothetical protein AVEN_226078-1 [Araneus ventricosus]|uniref:Uncharacterized protein n=1 Tax=Araneus ventricosus TaxID=182803 RepID=A0A4Y2GTN5_ARAVE|nr:hypothetical protein AVEN_226078-1 [Araneus ventricosus]